MTPPDPQQVAEIAGRLSKLVKAEQPLSHAHMRLDLRRDTRLLVQRSVTGHVHVTLGKDQATMILHPHAAVRLIADLQAVLTGADYAFD